MAELLLTLAVRPLGKYLLSWSARFSVAVTLLLAAVSVAAVATDAVSGDVLRVVSILRLVSLFELIGQWERFRFIFSCVISMAAGAFPVLLLLFTVTGAWVIAGTQAFGGLIYHANPALAETDLLDANYDVLALNDFAMGFMGFVGMLISGGPMTELIEGYGAAADCGSFWTGAFFMSFYVAGVLATFNVVASFVIDAFLAKYEADRVGGDEVDQEMESLLAANVVEDGWEVLATGASDSRRERLLKSMFADELEAILRADADGDDDAAAVTAAAAAVAAAVDTAA
jgi:two pore calcium channel protein